MFCVGHVQTNEIDEVNLPTKFWEALGIQVSAQDVWWLSDIWKTPVRGDQAKNVEHLLFNGRCETVRLNVYRAKALLLKGSRVEI